MATMNDLIFDCLQLGLDGEKVDYEWKRDEDIQSCSVLKTGAKSASPWSRQLTARKRLGRGFRGRCVVRSGVRRPSDSSIRKESMPRECSGSERLWGATVGGSLQVRDELPRC